MKRNRKRVMRFVWAIVLCLGWTAQHADAATWYVNLRNSASPPDGASWTTAFTSIQPAVDAAAAAGGGDVWIAAGVYGEARDVETGSLILQPGVNLYGGFLGTEADFAERNVKANTATLDGSESRAGEQAYHVVEGANACTLDGLTIRSGKAQGGREKSAGGGIYHDSGSLLVRNCLITGNEAMGGGGGIYLESGILEIEDSEVSINTSTAGGEGGGGIYVAGGTLKMKRCTVRGNRAAEGAGIQASGGSLDVSGSFFFDNGAGYEGGAANIEADVPARFTNTVFSGNWAKLGGGVTALDSVPRLTNCTFYGNDAIFGAGVCALGEGAVRVVNCVLWDMPGEEVYVGPEAAAIISYSDIWGGYEGEGNMDEMPLFANPSEGDFRIAYHSAGIDMGMEVPALETDSLGTQRPQQGGVDMGAFEYFVGQDSDNDGIIDEIEKADDPDADGLPSCVDPDSDGDGILDAVERDGDPDGDGAPNLLDLESDGDTIPDATEGVGDMDSDGIPSYLDLDSDGDGILDRDEGILDTDGDGLANFQDADSDADDIPDSVEGVVDSDNDGTLNYLDTDSDGDSVPDLIEGIEDANGDGVPNYLDIDSDSDNISDQAEGSGDFDGDGLPNFADIDSDGDGIADSVEGITDSDGDHSPNYLDTDSDADTILDKVEGASDTDMDTTPDYLDLDSDADTLPDQVEGPGDTDDDGVPNFRDSDSDEDGIPDRTEGTADPDQDGYMNSQDPDSDGDGLLDSTEGLADPDRDGLPSYLDVDSDGDGMTDASERPVVYVDRDNTSGGQDGSSWARAYSILQSAVDACANRGGGDVWVADGVYDEARPNAAGSLLLKPGVHLYGGFIGLGAGGGETRREQRNWATHITTIEGTRALNGGPALHVVVMGRLATLDGFVLSGGDASGAVQPDGSPGGGGGIYAYKSFAEIANSTIKDNHAPRGGALFTQTSRITLSNCVLWKNTAEAGGAVYSEGCTLVVVSDTIVGNSAPVGGGILDKQSSITLRNTLMWSNNGSSLSGESKALTLHTCLLENGPAETGILNEDPRLADEAKGDLRLSNCSPCIDAGSDAPIVPARDLVLAWRPYGQRVDIGAYEFQGYRASKEECVEAVEGEGEGEVIVEEGEPVLPEGETPVEEPAKNSGCFSCNSGG